MKIAVFSDSHDQVAHLQSALDAANAAGAEVLIHCGDLCAPFIVDHLGRNFAGPIHIVFGNNDGDGRLIQVVAGRFPQITLWGIYAELTVAGRALAVIHYPEPARRIAQSGQFDLVCYGHNHLKAVETVGNAVLANPGELLGKEGPPTWGLYDTETGRFEVREVGRGQ